MPRLITLTQLSVRLDVPARTLRHWAFSGYLPSMRLGRRYLFDEAALDAWFVQQAEAGAARK